VDQIDPGHPRAGATNPPTPSSARHGFWRRFPYDRAHAARRAVRRDDFPLTRKRVHGADGGIESWAGPWVATGAYAASFLPLSMAACFRVFFWFAAGFRIFVDLSVGTPCRCLGGKRRRRPETLFPLPCSRSCQRRTRTNCRKAHQEMQGHFGENGPGKNAARPRDSRNMTFVELTHLLRPVSRVLRAHLLELGVGRKDYSLQMKAPRFRVQLLRRIPPAGAAGYRKHSHSGKTVTAASTGAHQARRREGKTGRLRTVAASPGRGTTDV